MNETRQGFEAWAVVEIMGHKQVAGKVTEEAIAGVNMLRIDIPEADGHPAQTVYHGGQAVYAIHPCSEELARAAAAALRARQVDPFPVYVPDLQEARRTIEAARRATTPAPALTAGPATDDEEEYAWDEGPEEF